MSKSMGRSKKGARVGSVIAIENVALVDEDWKNHQTNGGGLHRRNDSFASAGGNTPPATQPTQEEVNAYFYANGYPNAQQSYNPAHYAQAHKQGGYYGAAPTPGGHPPPPQYYAAMYQGYQPPPAGAPPYPYGPWNVMPYPPQAPPQQTPSHSRRSSRSSTANQQAQQPQQQQQQQTTSKSHPLKANGHHRAKSDDNQESSLYAPMSSFTDNETMALISGLTGGYGATSAQQQQPQQRSPAPPSGKPRPSAMRRTNSAEVLVPTKEATPSLRSSAGATSVQPPRHLAHRRSNSDVPRTLAANGLSKGISGNRAPTDPMRLRKRLSDSSALSSRQRAFSTDNKPRARSFSGGGPLHKSSHSRSSSFAGSVATDTSLVSFVSDIRKSSMYDGVNDNGLVQMKYPFEKVHLVLDEGLPTGRIYAVANSEQMYEDYHRVTEDLDLWALDTRLDEDDFCCNCTCNNCNGCTGKRNLLPANYYVMAVDDDLYRRVLDEISDSQTMPCGLFFCGHHEDVRYPSVNIALVSVVLLLCVMGATAYILQ